MNDIINSLLAQLSNFNILEFIIHLSTLSTSDLIVLLLPWYLSGATLWMTFMAGNNNPRTWIVGLVNQALWLVWIILSKSWGLIPLNFGLWYAYYKNHCKWNKK